MTSSSSRNSARGAFTLIELITVMVIIAILALMTFPLLTDIKARVAKVRCIGNLKSLHVAAQSYLQQYNHWPQISAKLIKKNSPEYARQWIDVFAPYGVTSKSWICPTTQELLGGPNFDDPKLRRLDYIAMPFDDKPRTPYKWSTQPWFAEHSDVHQGGNLLIMMDGSVHQLDEFKKTK